MRNYNTFQNAYGKWIAAAYAEPFFLVRGDSRDEVEYRARGCLFRWRGGA